MAPKTDFPPVRACLFDMDGLLIDTEDIYTLCINTILARYGRPDMPWSIKAKMQGRPMPQANAVFMSWAQLPISQEQFRQENSVLQADKFPSTQPLPGVVDLLRCLGRTRYWDLPDATPTGHRVHIALATSSHAANFRLKTAHLQDLFSVFEAPRRVLGDDSRIAPGRGKPLPDIYLLALKTINDTLSPGEPPITPEECLVFEDSVPGVEAGRRAGMRVVWCPHPLLKEEYAGREPDVLAGTTGEAGDTGADTPAGQIDDGWSEYLASLESFPYHHYGIVVPSPEVDSLPSMKAAAEDPSVFKAESAPAF
ncbi:HAD superfamily hydrolase [Grosmannia clavigera kw1407]|uniref:HAD superfamily hydrolase n=1 Tax=Grosmannia clavigera (strain kw1407 / UAMH 11150) TaxID=655863 RepID=F0XSN8_GROCL|nr:HAD superfamily hydrolase [Grosmannia clavigera kw1407]EFW99255.1 HAD superfamily hydrolase [Grosmannia clavigera kw1407]